MHVNMIKDDISLVQFMYLVFTHMPGEGYLRHLRSLLLCLCNVFRVLINSLVCWFCMSALGLLLFQIFLQTRLEIKWKTAVCILYIFFYSTPIDQAMMLLCVGSLWLSPYISKIMYIYWQGVPAMTWWTECGSLSALASGTRCWTHPTRPLVYLLMSLCDRRRQTGTWYPQLSKRSVNTSTSMVWNSKRFCAIFSLNKVFVVVVCLCPNK